MPITVLIEASPLKAGVPTSVRMSSASANSVGVHQDLLEWLPVITSPPAPSWTIAAGDGQMGDFTLSCGTVGFRIGSRWGNREWNTYAWNGAQATAWIGDSDAPFSSYVQFFTGTLSGFARSGVTAELALRSVEGQLDVPLLSKRYAGTGAQEGPAGLRGTLKPRTYGYCQNVSPVLVDPALWVYQVHGYGPVRQIPAVYEFAQSLGEPLADVTDWATLAGYELVPGEWITCSALGMFRLGGRPDKKVTADVEGGFDPQGQFQTLLPGVVQQMLREAGISSQRVGDAAILGAFEVCLYQVEQATIAETVKRLVSDSGGYLFPDTRGVWRYGRWSADTPTIDLRTDRTSEPLVQTINELNAADPVWKVEIGHDRNWTVMGENDVSPALRELEGSVVAEEDLEEIRDLADQAKADAEFAKRETEAIIADGILDRSEKRRVIDRLEAERLIRNRLEGVYTIYNVVGEWSLYAQAFTNLEAYLTGLSPSLYDNTANTPVDRATYLSRFATYETAKQNLLNAMTGKARETATWPNVTGPGRPENDATKGAPPGTLVGGIPAEDVARDSQLAKDAFGEVDAAVKQAQQTITATQGEVSQARQDLAAEIARAKGAEGTLTTKVEQAQTDASGAKSSVATEITNRAEGDRAIGQRIDSLDLKVENNRVKFTDDISGLTDTTQSLGVRVQSLEVNGGGGSGDTSQLSARIEQVDAARISGDQALTSKTVTLEASAIQARDGGLNANPSFAYWPDPGVPPTPWNWWNTVGTISRSTDTLGKGGYAAEIGTVAGKNSGIYSNVYMTPGWYVMEADVWKLSGPWEGAGLTVGGIYRLDFLRDPDVNEQVGEVAYGGVRRFNKLFKSTTANYLNFHIMSSWVDYSPALPAKNIRWLRAAVRPATDGEIKGQKVISENLVARVTTSEGAISNLNGRAAAYWQTTAVAGNNRAQVTVRADANSGAGVDIVGDVTFTGSLNVGPDSGGNRTKITNNGMSVFDQNGQLRVRLGLW